jgi:excisionase family DNA binding protein
VNNDLTTREVAALLRCTPRKVTKTATEHGIGANLGGRAGFRFTEADIDALRESMRPVAESA